MIEFTIPRSDIIEHRGTELVVRIDDSIITAAIAAALPADIVSVAPVTPIAAAPRRTAQRRAKADRAHPLAAPKLTDNNRNRAIGDWERAVSAAETQPGSWSLSLSEHIANRYGYDSAAAVRAAWGVA